MTDTTPRPAATSRARRATPRRSISLAPDLLAGQPVAAPAVDGAAEPTSARKPRARKPTAASEPIPPATKAKTAPKAPAAKPEAVKSTPKAKPATKADAAVPEPVAKPAPAAAARSAAPEPLNPDAKPGEQYPGEPTMKLTTNVPESLHRRASGIVAHAQFTGYPENIRSLTDLIRDAVADYVDKIEQQHNDGDPFKAPAALRRGRRPTIS